MKGLGFPTRRHLFRGDRPARIPNHGEDVRLRRKSILIDADPETTSASCCRSSPRTRSPIFFEIIQRKGNEGFGEGKLPGAVRGIERDQMRRGVL